MFELFPPFKRIYLYYHCDFVLRSDLDPQSQNIAQYHHTEKKTQFLCRDAKYHITLYKKITSKLGSIINSN
jgi:hypothetical protein